MIRTNLSTRPFYNERAVHLVLALVAVLALAATVFNVTRVMQFSRRDTTLAMQATRDEARSSDLRAGASRLRASVDPKQIDIASLEAKQANDLIDRRTFSWTELFNRFETTLPEQVRITAVRPVFDPKRGNVLTIAVIARDVDDVSQFMENLEATGAFADLRPREEHFNDEGQLEGSLETVYAPQASAAPQKGGRR